MVVVEVLRVVLPGELRGPIPLTEKPAKTRNDSQSAKTATSRGQLRPNNVHLSGLGFNTKLNSRLMFLLNTSAGHGTIRHIFYFLGCNLVVLVLL